MVVTAENIGYLSQWGCMSTFIGGTTAAIDAGEANTSLILAGCSTSGTAADLCNNLIYKGYDDWYLPSKDQLAAIYVLHQNGVGGFHSGPYWSSTESPSNADLAYQHNFYDGFAFTVAKNNTCYVRAVRTFFKTVIPYCADIDGNIYDTVHFGSQIWFRENLKTSRYNDGAPIPKVTSNTTWGTLTSPAFCWWNNDSASNLYRGAYYNRYAASQPKLCPTGWRVPSDEDWKKFEMYMGLTQAEANATGSRGSNQGSKMAGENSMWLSGVIKNDPDFGVSGFMGLPYGYRYHNTGNFDNNGTYASWWSSDGWNRYLQNVSKKIQRLNNDARIGMTVRCMRDSCSAPDIANAGSDQLNIPGTNCQLSANNPTSGIGLWSLISGNGGNISNITSPNSSFSGITGQIYILVWGISNFCGQKNTDTVTVSFAPLSAPLYDIDGNSYDTVHIGTQVWMKENLRVSRYRNGDPIPSVTNSSTWSNLSSGAWCWYNHDSVAYNQLYGKLYNWHTMVDSRQVCPTGWHAPSDAEWKALEMYLGMTQAQVDSSLHRGTTEGGKLKSTGTTQWHAPNTGATNQVNFTALPSGYAGINQEFGGLGIQSTFWTSTNVNTSTSYNRTIRYDMSTISRSNSTKTAGYAIRCVKD